MRLILRAAFVFVAISTVPTMAMAWGNKGHAVVATIAQAHLTHSAKKHVREILKADNAENMAAVASWADQPAVKILPGQPMHTVRMSMDTQPYSDAIDCEMPCAIKGMRDMQKILTDQSSPMANKIVALKYIIHLTGDLHQPLHTVSNIGGQAVVLKGEATTLHHVWDNLIIQDQGQSVIKLAKALDSDYKVNPAISGGPEQWAVEGREIAMNEIYSEIAPARKSASAVTLSDDYTARHWPTVAIRLEQAGLRLAAVLNQIYGN